MDTIVQLKVEKTIAKGSQGMIFLTTFNDRKVTLKVETSNFPVLANEYAILSQIKHCNVISPIAFYEKGDASIKVICDSSVDPGTIPVDSE